MCALCGLRVKDMDANVNAMPNKPDVSEPESQGSAGTRVTVIGGKNIVITQEEARWDAKLMTERLIGMRKLALVLDLDHTLTRTPIHAPYGPARETDDVLHHLEVRAVVWGERHRRAAKERQSSWSRLLLPRG